MPAITQNEHLLHKTFFNTNRTTHSPNAAQQVAHKSHLQYQCTQGTQILHPSLPSKCVMFISRPDQMVIMDVSEGLDHSLKISISSTFCNWDDSGSLNTTPWTCMNQVCSQLIFDFSLRLSDSRDKDGVTLNQWMKMLECLLINTMK